MTLVDLIDAFRRDADDLARPYLHSDDDVTVWLNEAEQEACSRANLIYDSEIELYIDTSTRTYETPVTLISLLHASLTDSAGDVTEIGRTDRIEMDRTRPGWRTESRQPTAVIHDETKIEVDATPDAAYTLTLEGYRLPKKEMIDDSDEPEISEKHRRYLVKWALYRAYSVPDKDFADPKKAKESEQEFERYFGLRPSATQSRIAASNRPHRNKACW